MDWWTLRLVLGDLVYAGYLECFYLLFITTNSIWFTLSHTTHESSLIVKNEGRSRQYLSQFYIMVGPRTKSLLGTRYFIITLTHMTTILVRSYNFTVTVGIDGYIFLLFTINLLDSRLSNVKPGAVAKWRTLYPVRRKGRLQSDRSSYTWSNEETIGSFEGTGFSYSPFVTQEERGKKVRTLEQLFVSSLKPNSFTKGPSSSRLIW